MNSLDTRVSRILGQMRGIQKMVKEKRNCTEILQQIASVKKAVDGLTREIVVDHLYTSIPAHSREEIDTMIRQVIDL